MSKLLIACRFKRPNAPVELPNGDGTFTAYYFRPIDPANPDSEHVAEVWNPDHIQRLLQISEGYYVSQSGDRLKEAAENAAAIAAGLTKPAPAPAAPTPPAKEPEAPPPADTAPPANPEADKQPDPTGEPDAAANEAANEAAEALLALPLSKIKEAIPSTSKSVLALALEIERGKGSDERVTVTKALNAAL